MICARCGKELIRSRDWTWSILPCGNKPVPTCRDDRQCYSKTSLARVKPKRPKPVKQPSPKMVKVKALAKRFAS